ncbi:MAG: hypothetical protein M1576_03205 [Deltaproteobacteria bacterium]|nr:hypothetical protein [Deltaproteobacteria bacterium]
MIKEKCLVCGECNEEVYQCDNCFKDFNLADKIICDDKNDYGYHYCSKKCVREAYDYNYSEVIEVEKEMLSLCEHKYTERFDMRVGDKLVPVFYCKSCGVAIDVGNNL